MKKKKDLAFQQSWRFVGQRSTVVVVWNVKYAFYSFISLFLCVSVEDKDELILIVKFPP